MKPVVLRFVALAVLFAAWILYLVYQVAHLPQSPNGLPVILSRPQFLVSDLDVVGTIDAEDRTLTALQRLQGTTKAGPDGGLAVGLAAGPALQIPETVRVVTVQEVLYPARGSFPVKAGGIIGVTNFGECRIPPDKLDKEPAKLPSDLSALGPCLLPLRTLDGGLTWEVVPLPPSPGFAGTEWPRIYPADAETLAQYRQIGK
jgi:hypothetical protein